MTDITKSREEAAASMYPKYADCPVGSFNKETQRPLYHSDVQKSFQPVDKLLTNDEKMRWKIYQLWRCTLKVERRDGIYYALTAADLTNYAVEHFWCGSPFPMIEPSPHFFEVLKAIRWYEHVSAVGFAILYYQFIKSRPIVATGGAHWFAVKLCMYAVYFNIETIWCVRSYWRLTGQVPNDYECYKYGVFETPERLKQKAVQWQRLRDYKEEWCKRFDYYVYGMRPGERKSLGTTCFWNPCPIVFCKKYDYPMRRNPYYLTVKPIKDLTPIDNQVGMIFGLKRDAHLFTERPEMKYINDPRAKETMHGEYV